MIIKYIFIFILILNYFNISESTITVKELFYGNSSVWFYDYPKSTADLCQVNIPFQITSDDKVIDTIIVPGPLSFIETYTSPKEIIITLSSNISASAGNSFQFKVGVYDETLLYSEFSYEFYCIGYDTNKLNHTILNTGIYYNTLSFMVKFNEYLTRPNVTLALYVPVPFTQRYLGDNIYSISLNYNTPFNTIYDYKIIFSNDTSYTITLTSPFKYSNGLPSRKLYFSYGKAVAESAYYELTIVNNLNSYFSTLTNGSYSNYYYEPFLISSNKYLAPLVSSNPTFVTNYTLSYYYSNSNLLVFTEILNQTTINIAPSNVIQDRASFFNEITLFSISNHNYPLIFQVGSKVFRYPYGIYNSTINSAVVKVVVPIPSIRFQRYDSSIIMNGIAYDSFQVENDVSVQDRDPIVDDYSIELIKNGKMRIVLNITNSDLVGSISFYNSPSTIYKTFSFYELSTTGIFSSLKDVFEIVLPRFNLYKFSIILKKYKTIDYVIDSSYVYKISNQAKSLTSIKDLDKLPTNFDYLTSLKNVTFLLNDLVVTNKGVSNKMFISLDSYPTDREVKVSFIYSDYRANEKKDIVYSTYNPTTSQFEFEFNIPKNIKPGNVSYTITLDSLDNINYYSYSLPLEYQLRVSESLNIDLFGPVVTNIQVTSLLVQFKAGYTIEITDSANGFKQGYIIVKGSIDMTERNLTITTSNLYAGTIFKGVYSVGFDYDTPCNVQVFSIVYAYFEDTEGYSTEYDVLKANKKNPFYLIQDIFPSIVSICDSPMPTTDGYTITPVFSNLEPPVPKLINPTKESRIYNLNYTVSHPDGISTTILPKLYSSFAFYEYVESFETIVISSTSNSTYFSSKVILPYYSEALFFSIYGALSKSSAHGSMLGSNSLILYPAYPTPSPAITDSSKLSSTGLGGLWLYGLYFYMANTTNDFQIQYTDEEDGGLYNTIIPTIIYSNAVYFPTIKATNKTINFKILNSLSDPYSIYPVVYSFVSPTNDNNTSLCKGSPLCGGPSQGTCISSGCQCISPWTGIDCMSKVIQVTQPEINQTNPSTNITTGEEATINSIISIIGIKELSVNSNEVNKYSFEEWEYKLILNDSYVTRYTYSSYIKKNNIKVSNITVTLDWYKVESTIQFANEELHINPSSIKYTIQISSYPFTSQLNTLQLIMKASVQTTNSESCLDKQFGESIQEDADYIKLQIDKYSIYGRFIKRCQIDNSKITKLTNTLLDSQMNDIDTINNSSQSYIGINIPQFSDNVIIDPDFSVLLDSNFASCNSGSSGLTTSQLAGIIVGSVAFFIVFIIILVLLIYKSPGCLNTKIFIYKVFKKSKV